MAGGYDISQSTSESATQASSLNLSGFSVGGGLKIPALVWYAAAALVAFIVWKKFGSK